MKRGEIASILLGCRAVPGERSEAVTLLKVFTKCHVHALAFVAQIRTE
jgi:hypothetical protein